KMIYLSRIRTELRSQKILTASSGDASGSGRYWTCARILRLLKLSTAFWAKSWPSPQINLNEMIGLCSLSEYVARAKYACNQKSGRKLRDWFDRDRGTSWRKSNAVGLWSRFSHRLH